MANTFATINKIDANRLWMNSSINDSAATAYCRDSASVAQTLEVR